MLAVRLHATGAALRLEQVPDPEPRGAEVRIRVAGAGVCHTDLHIVDGTQPRVELPVTLGHEVAGWIDAAGPDAQAALVRAGVGTGDAVLVYGGWGCGECRDCTGGAEPRCAASRAPGFQVDGGYAQAMLVPDPRHLVALRELDPVRAAPLADAGVTPYRAVNRVERWLAPRARVLVIGCGALGSFALQYLRLRSGGEHLRVVVREVDEARLERATSLGADVALIDHEHRAIREALGGAADVVLDCVGSDATLADAARLVAPGGVVMLVGEYGGSLRFGYDAVPVESWFTTVAWGSREDLAAVVGLAGAGRLQWNVETLPLRDADAAHARLRDGHIDGRLVLVP